MYWIDLYKDIRLWIKFAKVAKENRSVLEEASMRVDRLGRIYTVINLPEEIQQGNEYMHEAWVLQNLKPFSEILLKIGLADYSYPELSKIEESGTCAYLVVMYPEVETIGGWPILKNIVIYGLVLILLKILYNLFFSYQLDSYVTQFINYIF